MANDIDKVKSVVEQLAAVHPPFNEEGYCVFCNRPADYGNPEPNGHREGCAWRMAVEVGTEPIKQLEAELDSETRWAKHYHDVAVAGGLEV